jgi:hypothetical protein
VESLLAKVREYHLGMIVELNGNNEKFEAPWGTLLSQMDMHQDRTETNQWEMMAKMDSWIKRLEVCVGKLEANREKSDAIAEHQEVPRKRRNGCSRPFGTNSLNEGAMWHVGPLLSNDRETNN